MRCFVPLMLLVACGTGAEPHRAAPSGRDAVLEGVEVSVPGAVLRAGHVTLGGLGLSALADLAGTAHAEPPSAPPEEDVEVDADRLALTGQGSGAVLTGHVRLRRGALELTCDRLETRTDSTGAIAEARASGSVRIERSGLVATAASARLDLARGELVLEGPVRLVRAEGTLEGARVVLSLASGNVTVERVRGRLRMRSGRAP